MIKPLPCPYCGASEPRIKPVPGGVVVICGVCSFSSPVRPWVRGAIMAWNSELSITPEAEAARIAAEEADD